MLRFWSQAYPGDDRRLKAYIRLPEPLRPSFPHYHVHPCKQEVPSLVAGGVSANKKLRSQLETMSKQNGIECYVPKMEYCTDNAAMIGSAAYYAYCDNIGIADMGLAPKPNLSL